MKLLLTHHMDGVRHLLVVGVGSCYVLEFSEGCLSDGGISLFGVGFVVKLHWDFLMKDFMSKFNS